MIIKGIARDYWNSKKTHRPYRNLLHTEDDTARRSETIPDLLSGIPDGHGVEIMVRDLGPHDSAKGFIWQLTAVHTYTRVRV